MTPRAGATARRAAGPSSALRRARWLQWRRAHRRGLDSWVSPADSLGALPMRRAPRRARPVGLRSATELNATHVTERAACVNVCIQRARAALEPRASWAEAAVRKGLVQSGTRASLRYDRIDDERDESERKPKSDSHCLTLYSQRMVQTFQAESKFKSGPLRYSVSYTLMV